MNSLGMICILRLQCKLTSYLNRHENILIKFIHKRLPCQSQPLELLQILKLKTFYFIYFLDLLNIKVFFSLSKWTRIAPDRNLFQKYFVFL